MRRGFRGGRFGGDPDEKELKHDIKVTLSDFDPAIEAFAPKAAQEAERPVQRDVPSTLKQLTPLEVEDVVKRAAPIQAQVDDESAFRLRDASLKAPKTGDVVAVEFPPKEAPPAEMHLSPAELAKLAQKEAGALTIERFSPTGDVDAVSTISLTFSQPMIELSSVTEIANNPKNAVMSVTPAVTESRFVWKGTNTVQLEVNAGLGRLPKSTQYTVSVPMETVSQLGGKLEKPFSFSFKTATLQITRLLPSTNAADLNPIILLEFNQRMDPQDLLKYIKISTSRNTLVGFVGKAVGASGTTIESTNFKLVPESDLINSEQYKNIHKDLKKDHWMVFRCGEPLPKHSKIEVIVKPDAPSAEGPLRTTAEQKRHFYTYPPFALKETYPKDPTPPSSQWTFYFTTVINEKTFNKDMISIKPELPSFSVRVSGWSVVISNHNPTPKQSYTITFDPKRMKDIHDQTLEGNSHSGSISVTTEPLVGYLTAPQQQIVLDPAVKNPYFEIQVQGYTDVVLEYYHVEPHMFLQIAPNWWNFIQKRSKHFLSVGKLVHTEIVKPTLKENTMTPVKIPIKQYLQFPEEILGQIVVVAYPTEKAWSHIAQTGLMDRLTGPKFDEHRPVSWTWIQATRIGLDIVVSPSQGNAETFAWVTRLTDGKPIASASVLFQHPAAAIAGTVVHKEELANIKPLTICKDNCGQIGCPKGHPLQFGLVPFNNSQYTCGAKLRLCKQHGSGASYHCEQCKFVCCSSCFYNAIRGKAIQTNVDGLAIVPMTTGTAGARILPGTVVAKSGNDVAFCISNSANFPQPQLFSAFILNDRGLYRPKETVTLKGYIRRLEHNGPITTPRYFANAKVDYRVVDSRNADILKGSLQTNEYGAFDLSVPLPDNMNLGNATAYVNYEKECSTHSFRVEEFRRPEYECKAQIRPKEGHVSASPSISGTAIASVHAAYFAGGALSDATARWTVTVSQSSYAPPGWNEYSFGVVRNWWTSYANSEKTLVTANHNTGKTNPDGNHELKIEYSGNVTDPRPQPLLLKAVCNVVDLNNQSIQSSSSVTLHPSDYYVGLLVDSKAYLKAGDVVKVKVIVVDHDGHLVGGVAVKTEARRTYQAETVDTQGMSKWEQKTDTVIGSLTSAKEPVTFSYTPTEGGQFSFAFIVADKRGCQNQTVSSKIYVQGPGANAPEPLTSVVLQPRALTLVPSKKEFVVGEEGEVMIQSALAPAEGLLLVEYKSVIFSKRFQLLENTQTVSFPIHDWCIPNAQIRVILNGAEPRGKPRLTYVTCNKNHPLVEMIPLEYAESGGNWKCDVCDVNAAPGSASNHCKQCGYDMCAKCFAKKAMQLEPGADPKKDPVPAMATAVCSISVSRQHRNLNVKVVPAESSYRPGAEAKVTIDVANGGTKQAEKRCEVAVIVVDESVLSLTGHQLKNPLEDFYATRAHLTTASQQRTNVVLLTSLHEQPEEENVPEEDLREEGGEATEEEEGDKDSLRGREKKKMKSSRLRSGNGGGGEDSGGAPPAAFAMFSSSASMAAPAPAPAPRMMMQLAASPRGAPPSAAVSTEAPAKIEVRSNFSALAFFKASTIADEQGRCVVQFKLPDSLTRFRVWAVAVSETCFGLGESLLSVQLPLAVRPSWPRFFNVGDRAEASVVIQNQIPTDQNVSVVLRCTNAALQQNLPAIGYVVPVKANGRASLTFGVETKRAGTARFQIIALSQGFADASELDVPVFTPATTEAFATYGDLGDAQKVLVQPVKPPSSVYAEYGGLEVSTSSTALSSLTDAVLDLIQYPFDCSEQLSSRTLGVVGLKDILAAFNAKGMPSSQKIHIQMARDMAELVHRQYSNGGFAFWRPTSYIDPSPYISAHVTHSIGRAKALGVNVSEQMLQKAIAFCRGMDSYVSSKYYGKQTKLSLVSYAIYARARAGDKNADEDAASYLTKHGVEEFPLEALGWLLGAMIFPAATAAQSALKTKITAAVELIQKHIRNKVNETAETANFITSYGDDGQLVMLHSDRRTDAVLLESLVILTANPTWPGASSLKSLVPKLVRGLLAHRVRGKFRNTQENCFVLLAMDAYFKQWENQTPDFVVRVWLGETWAGEQSFKGRSVDSKALRVPMQNLREMAAAAHSDTQQVIVQKEGAGRLYYRIGLSYAPADLQLKAASYGFQVSREYLAVAESGEKDAPKDAISIDSTGAIHVKLGSTIRVKLTMITPSRRYHVALVDKLPAGFEALNPALNGTPTLATSSTADNRNPFLCGRWYDPVNWFEHQNLRDERAEAFKSLLWQGIYTYEYICRATAAGRFIVPPAKAEEMYSPEIYGRSSTNIVVVE